MTASVPGDRAGKRRVLAGADLAEAEGTLPADSAYEGLGQVMLGLPGANPMA